MQNTLISPPVPTDNQNKTAWVEAYGLVKETEFVEKNLPLVPLQGRINPAKKHNKFTNDLEVIFPSELKTIDTPFFKSGEMFAGFGPFDPQYTATFNKKDYDKYKVEQPDWFTIFFHLHFVGHKCALTIRGREYKVNPIDRIYIVQFFYLKALIESGKAPLHKYGERQNDQQGNAKDSYIIDLRAYPYHELPLSANAT